MYSDSKDTVLLLFYSAAPLPCYLIFSIVDVLVCMCAWFGMVVHTYGIIDERWQLPIVACMRLIIVYAID